QVRCEVLRHLAATVVDLQQVTNLVGRSIIAAAMPQVTAKKQHISGVAKHRLRKAAVPVQVRPPWPSPCSVASGYNVRWAQLLRLGAEVKMGGAEEHRHMDPLRHPRLRPFHREIVQMKTYAAVPWVAAPCGLPDDVTVAPERHLRNVDDPS